MALFRRGTILTLLREGKFGLKKNDRKLVLSDDGKQLEWWSTKSGLLKGSSEFYWNKLALLERVLGDEFFVTSYYV